MLGENLQLALTIHEVQTLGIPSNRMETMVVKPNWPWCCGLEAFKTASMRQHLQRSCPPKKQFWGAQVASSCMSRQIWYCSANLSSGNLKYWDVDRKLVRWSGSSIPFQSNLGRWILKWFSLASANPARRGNLANMLAAWPWEPRSSAAFFHFFKVMLSFVLFSPPILEMSTSFFFGLKASFLALFKSPYSKYSGKPANLCIVGCSLVWTWACSTPFPSNGILPGIQFHMPDVPISCRRANCELQGFIAFVLDLKEDQAPWGLAVWLAPLAVWCLLFKTPFSSCATLSNCWPKCHLETCIYMQCVQKKCTQVRPSERNTKFIPFAHVVCEFQTTPKQLLFLVEEMMVSWQKFWQSFIPKSGSLGVRNSGEVRRQCE